MNRTNEIAKLGLLKNSGKIEPKELKDSYIKHSVINELDLATKLYRIISYDRLIESLKGQYLTMAKRRKWEDPAETFLLNNNSIDKTNGSIVNFDNIRDRIYGQCWSMNEESAALWKIYSLNKRNTDINPVTTEARGNNYFEDHKTVKIRSTGNKLINSLYDINNPISRLSYFIGRVKYVNIERIKKWCDENLNKYFYDEGMPMIEHLFFKQNAYKFENEVRLIFMAQNHMDKDYSLKRNFDEEYYKFHIDVNSVIEEIIFHPDLDDDTYEKMKVEIEKLGYNNKDSIKKSQLYTPYDQLLKF